MMLERLMNQKGFGRKGSWPNQGTILALPGGTEENHKTSVRIPSFPAEIRIEHLLNISLSCNFLTNLFSYLYFSVEILQVRVKRLFNQN